MPRRTRALARRLWRSGLVAALTMVVAAVYASPSAAANRQAAAEVAAEQAAADDWTPPANLAQGLDEVWRHVESTYGNLYGFRNYGWDQLMANGGRLQYCVRWESNTPVTAQLRDQINASVQRQWTKWFDGLRGWGNFPYAQVPVQVVGWAARDRSLLQWNDNSVDLYIGNLDSGGAPRCAPECDRFHHQDGNYSRCPGGAARHFDQSLWLTDGFGGGAGGDWGQRMGREYYMGAVNQDNIHILLHEMGHTLGLDDFYDWTPTGVGGFLMKAGTASQITEFDRWMARDFWRHLRSRYGL
ncbi:hypothetical protein [Streptomyces sp. NPDC127098]|uniref:hypothetical protein n=1 Tax=Streptomyces sp. NPDC127098 TaxID=3347137 RepID=UPI00366215B7